MVSQEVRDTVKQLFREYMERRHLRKTMERYAVLDAIYSIEGHFDVEDLYKLMEKAHFRVSMGTIYNTVALLLDAHLIVKHQFGMTAQYEKCYSCETHHHLICTQCGKVTEVTSKALRNTIESMKFRNFTQTHYSLYVYGICVSCKRANTRKLKKQQKTNKK